VSRIPRARFALLALLAAAGCGDSRRQRPADSLSTVSATTTTVAHTIALRGDFKGPLGVQLYSFRDAMPKDVRGTLRRVHDLGFREVELAGTYGMSAGDFRRVLDSAGLAATSMHAGYEQFRDSLTKVLADAKALGVKFVGTAWIPHPDGPLTPAMAREAAANFNKWGRAAKQQGVQFFYHCHGYEFVPDAAGVRPMDILMRQTNDDAVKYEMDVFWISRPGADPVAWLHKYPTRWRLLHLKDMKQGTPMNVNTGSANPDSTEVPVGTGQIDYRGVLRAAQEIGAQEFYLEDETSAPFTTVPRSITWLEQVSFNSSR
jgi:sugar phosphate isomerase/epimerase